MPDAGPTTYVAMLPETITIREGSTSNLALNFVGMTNHRVSYSYQTSTSGGTAGASDIEAVSGRGSLSVMSSYPYDYPVNFSISATRDGVHEDFEIAYLIVELSGNMYFRNGSQSQVVAIRIADDNWSIGGARNDVLRGTSSAEDLIGDLGDDSYYITAGDRVIETAAGGTDTVYAAISHALAAHVENLTLTGAANVNAIGNTLANRLVGNAGNNLLNGGIGADSMSGGVGNDLYVVDNSRDLVVEAANGGTDRVQSSISHALTANVENLTLTGAANTQAFGNALANRLVGNAGNNLLNGGIGADSMSGGAGNDLYVVDNSRDLVVEAANGGIDSVQSSVSHALTAHVENLTLTGAANVNAIGNTLANRLVGNAGNNVVNGGAGNDTLLGGVGNDQLLGGVGNDLMSGGIGADRLIGGVGADRMSGDLGADIFVFQTLADSTTALSGRDVIADFSVSQGDRIDLGALDANAKLAGNQAFAFIGGKGFSGHAGELAARVIGGQTQISGDVNGDRIADFTILLDDPLSLGANSFLL